MKRSKRETKERNERRHVQQVGGHFMNLVIALMTLGIFGKVPLIQASDVLTLALVCEAFLELNWSWEAVAAIFIASHTTRCPRLLRKLWLQAKRRQQPTLHSSVVASWLREVLAASPFADQDGGLPYWTSYTRFHSGTAQVLKWLEPEYELLFFSAASALISFSQNKMSASDATSALQALPGLKEYGYHVLRSWGACIRWVRQADLVTLPRLKPMAEEYVASHMSEHVKVIYEIIGSRWGKFKYDSDLRAQGVVKGQPLRCEDRSLIACELQEFLLNLKLVPTQADVRAKKMTPKEYVGLINQDGLRSLLAYVKKRRR